MLSRNPKFLPEDGTTPKQGLYACRTCKQWFASSCGRTGHLKKHPDHQTYSLLSGHDSRPAHGPGRPRNIAPLAPGLLHPSTNGHHALGASARDLLLDYILEKAKVDLNAELDRMFRDLKSQPVRGEPAQGEPVPASSVRPPASRRTYVAR